MTASGVDETACSVCRGSGRVTDTRLINVCTFNGATRQTWECLHAEISPGGMLARVRSFGQTLYARRELNRFGEFWFVVRAQHPAHTGYGV